MPRREGVLARALMCIWVGLNEIRRSKRDRRPGVGIVKRKSRGVGRSFDSILDCLTGVEGHCYIRPRFVALPWISRASGSNVEFTCSS